MRSNYLRNRMPGAVTGLRISAAVLLSLSAIQARAACGDPLEDVQGNSYETVEIDGLCWTRTNFKATEYNDGTAIESSTMRVYSGCSSYNPNTFGRLYNSFALRDGAICPAGWRVPSDNEWQNLRTYVGGDGYRLIPGGDTGFDAVVAGQFYNGHFEGCGSNDQRYFWSESRMMYQIIPGIQLYTNTDNGNYYYSLRCVQEALQPDTDADSIADSDDNCPALANPDQRDLDGDGVGDVCDNCLLSNADQLDEDGNEMGDLCDALDEFVGSGPVQETIGNLTSQINAQQSEIDSLRSTLNSIENLPPIRKLLEKVQELDAQVP